MKLIFSVILALALALLIMRFPMCSSSHAADALPGDSIYQLRLPLSSQDGDAIGLDVYRGHPTLITMFYGSCPFVCPTLINSIQHMEGKLDAPSRGRLRVLLVSLDPERDTPAALGELAKRHHADLTRWRFAQTPEAEVRKLAAVLGVQYRKLPDGSFNHSTVITLLDRDGRIAAQTSAIGRLDEDFVKQLGEATAH
jgi:protein SCO1/2